MNANDIQIGGDHYRKAGNLQHWDMLPALGFGWEYYIGAATKYMTRVKDVDLDPKKAGHFVTKLVELVHAGLVPTSFNTVQGIRLHADGGTKTQSQRVDVEEYLAGYWHANGIDPKGTEAKVIQGLMMAHTVEDLQPVLDLLKSMEPKKAVPSSVKAEVKQQIVATTNPEESTDKASEAGPGYTNQDKTVEPMKTTDTPTGQAVTRRGRSKS